MLKAAVQNGADSVYFGSSSFSARAFASNFDLEELEEAITYAKLRGVKTFLTLNTLIKDDEFMDAMLLAKTAYEYGIDAIIVQDLGLGKALIDTFKDLLVHASTQMSVHNLQGVLELEKLGFKRVVLSRELSANEIEYICSNSNIEIECFIHGALCISYSGQCLFSSAVGGRSGNRGKCAQSCRLPYDLLENNRKIDSGFLLSPRDLCGLEFLPFLVDSGVSCFKIEGRMKSIEYVATVTRIYKKYLSLAKSSRDYVTQESDKKELLQVFNRGMFSSGHLDKEPNRDLVFKEKPNNMGLFLGIVQKYSKNKGYITLKTKEDLAIGDTISLENETGSYTVSELMEDGKNIKIARLSNTITIGRMKGNINLGDKIYKISSKALSLKVFESSKKENKKIPLKCKVTIKKGQPISIKVTTNNDIEIYKDLDISFVSNVVPVDAENRPLEKEQIINQISKTTSTPYMFDGIKVDMDKNLFLPKLSALNELRREALMQVNEFALSKIRRFPIDDSKLPVLPDFKVQNNEKKDIKISVLLNILNLNFDYSNLNNAQNIYIPYKYFTDKNYKNIIEVLSQKADIFVYLPTIIKANYKNLISSSLEKVIKNYKIKGFVFSNISNFLLLDNLLKDNKDDFKFICNYTFNVFNTYSINELKRIGADVVTISPELDKNAVINLCDNFACDTQLIVYGKAPLMNINYCPLGKTNKCYPDCKAQCMSNNSYFLKDRLGFNFRIIPDALQTVSTIYNSKTTSIKATDFNISFARIDILDEDVDKINEIIQVVSSGNRFEGNDFTNGNLYKEI